MQNKDRIISKDFIMLFATALATNMTFFFLNATMPLYSTVLTGSEAYTGYMPGAFTIAALLSRPITSMVVKRMGRVFTMILGCVVTVIAFILYPMASDIYLLIVLRFFHGFGFGFYSTASGAVAADILPPSRLIQGIGIYNLSSTIANAIGPGIALSIIGPAYDNFNPLFMISIGFSIIAVLTSVMVSYERKAKREGRSLDSMTTASGEVIDELEGGYKPKYIMGIETTMLTPALSTFMLHFSQTAVTSFLALAGVERNFGNVGLFFTVAAVTVFVVRLSVGKLLEKYGSKAIMIPCFVVYVICVAAIAFTKSFTVLLIIAVFYGAAQGLLNSTVNALFFQVTIPKSRAVASSVYFTALDIGIACASFILSAIARGAGYTMMYLAAAVLGILAFACYLLSEKTAERVQRLMNPQN